MSNMESHQVRELLRGVRCPGLSRDIVGAGLIGKILTIGPMVEVEFKPTTRDTRTIDEVELKIRTILLKESFVDVQIRRVNPEESEVPLSGVTNNGKDPSMDQHAQHRHDHDHPHDHEHHHDHGDHHADGGCGCGSGASSRQMTPLQAEFLEDGELPEDDLLAIVLGRVDIATAAGYGPGGPQPLAGPRESFSYDCGIKVLQWDIDPHNAQSTTCQHEIKVAEWDYRVWWQVHPNGDLLYVSMQAMREDWVDNEDAVPHPVGRSEAVNLVYDEARDAVVAIYGTVRDFRPFVKAFALAHAKEVGKTSESSTQEGTEQ
jgi:metal-sulfur cluster biosynthetic enzyme